MPKSFVRRIPWIAGVAAVLLTGCYTVIMHPQVENERKTAEDLRVQCIDCHVDYHVYPYDPYDSFFGADYYWTNPRYGYYYGYPWWWDDYYWYYYNNPDDPGTYPAEPREYGRPSYRGGAPSRDPGYAPPQLKSGVTTGARISTPGAQSSDAPGDTTVTAPDTRTIDPDQHITGQPLWTSPKGTIEAKPPELRHGVDIDPEIIEKVSGGSSGSTTNTNTATTPSTPPPAKKTVTKEEKKTETQEKKEDKPRGRPRRNPR